MSHIQPNPQTVSRWPQRVLIGAGLVAVIANVLFFLGRGSSLFMLQAFVSDPWDTDGILERVSDALLTIEFWVSDHQLEGAVYAICLLMFLSLLVGTQVALVTGVRRLRTGHQKGHAIRLLIVGIALASYAALLPISLAWWRGEIVETLRHNYQDTTRGMRALIDSNRLSPEKQARLWTRYAADVYTETGDRILIPQPDGAMLMYEPSETDIRSRDTWNQLIRPELPHRSAATWATLALLGICIGLVTTLKR